METLMDTVRFLLYLAGKESGSLRWGHRIAARRVWEEILGFPCTEGSLFTVAIVCTDEDADTYGGKVLLNGQAEYYHSVGYVLLTDNEVHVVLPMYVDSHIPHTVAECEGMVTDAVYEHLYPGILD